MEVREDAAMGDYRSLDHCFRYSGAPEADHVAHAALIEVQTWRMLHEARRRLPDLEAVGVLDRWVGEQRTVLAREPAAEERDYRLRMLDIAAERVRGRLCREHAAEIAS